LNNVERLLKKMDKVIENGNTIQVQYKGYFDDNEVFDQSKDPLEFEVGKKQVIKGFEEAVVGMKKGDKKTFHVKAEEAYGQHKPEFVQKIPKQAVANLKELKEGQIIGLQDNQGRQFMGKVIKIEDEFIELDFNHPLAGKDLNFDIEIVDIK